jgi:hypothetical protein
LRLCAKQKLYFARRRRECKGRHLFFYLFSAFFASLRETKKNISRRGAESAKGEFIFSDYFGFCGGFPSCHLSMRYINALKEQHILARRNAAGYDFSNIHRPERATYSSPPQHGGLRCGGLRCGGLRFNINKPSRSDIALSGRWILKIHDSHRIAVGWIILPRWGVGNFIVIRLI